MGLVKEDGLFRKVSKKKLPRNLANDVDSSKSSSSAAWGLTARMPLRRRCVEVLALPLAVKTMGRKAPSKVVVRLSAYFRCSRLSNNFLM